MTILQGGPLAEAVEGLGVSVRLHHGCLVTNLSKELATTSEERVAVHELDVYSLSGLAKHQLLAMPADPVAANKADLLLNQVSNMQEIPLVLFYFRKHWFITIFR